MVTLKSLWTILSCINVNSVQVYYVDFIKSDLNNCESKPIMIAKLRALIAASLIMIILDLIWLGGFADSFYSAQLGALRAQEVVVSAAMLFYIQYVVVVVFFGAMPAPTVGRAAARGALLGWFAYSTYELTNWAVIEGWPKGLVVVDIAWGVLLTGLVSACAKWAHGIGESASS